MRVIVAGGRDFIPKIKHSQWLQEKLKELEATEIISGGASGADSFGERIALMLRIPIKHFYPNWNLYGKAAGPMRNEQMALNADACILFPGGRGTASMKSIALRKGLKVIEYKGKDEELL